MLLLDRVHFFAGGICIELDFQLSVASWLVTVLKNQSQLPPNALASDSAARSIEVLEDSCSCRVTLLVRFRNAASILYVCCECQCWHVLEVGLFSFVPNHRRSCWRFWECQKWLEKVSTHL